MTINQYRRRWLRLRKGYENTTFEIFLNAVNRGMNNIPIDNLTEYNYQLSVSFNVLDEYFIHAYIETYTNIGLDYGRVVGADINASLELKRFSNPFFSEEFARIVSNFIRFENGNRITSVIGTFKDFIIQSIQSGIAEGLSIQSIVQGLKDNPSLYRWQIRRIARTESTSAANYGAQQSAKSSGVVLEKVWVSATDARTRRTPPDKFDHLEMNGVSVGQNEPFMVGGDLIQYPGDVKGKAGNVINCRCTHGYRPKRDSEGRIVTITQ